MVCPVCVSFALALQPPTPEELSAARREMLIQTGWLEIEEEVNFSDWLHFPEDENEEDKNDSEKPSHVSDLTCLGLTDWC
jgi:hypothetical protein